MTFMHIFKLMLCSTLTIVALSVALFINFPAFESTNNMNSSIGNEKLSFGNFSVSLAVKDIEASRDFYEKMDFVKIGGDLKHNYLIMQSGTTTIGLFQGMFKDNILTFNPGWNHKSEQLDKFQDVRDIQSVLRKRGIAPVKAADENSIGPTSFVVVDPDGNSILIDQHVPKP